MTDILRKKIHFGNYKGWTWGKLMSWHRDYVQWAAIWATCVSASDKQALQEALKDSDPGDYDEDWDYCVFQDPNE